ncbi:MAG: hypothetical protein A2826_01395 [Candidatus Doudnabacteria bacterium RIFCSPHIGHO2_01_FULL_43_23]|uniref:Uncharacterized protein n=1 Tax=Candidatus Doudnabacteria bacterium RIFCSPHIGHO2_01_FULL_43_23 TaxID=1817822 RepID=A0A1F5NRU1_9BACT|nr:MAG: hypothetical protein A2826_01395 [Candidatus Doudnabacteria bacterium RIFCSPHIGHO2_01_FULL_43_23]
MENLELFAQPWPVNLLILVPFLAFIFWRKEGLDITKRVLLVAFLFGVGFGFVEAAVVVYLRAAMGLLPGYEGTLADIQNLSLNIYQQAQILSELPQSLLYVELFREGATLLMLLSVAYLSAQRMRDRWAIFLYIFATWDIFYYIGLWLTVRWPSSLLTPDVLFLIPVPWYSQVWYPLLVSLLSILVVIFCSRKY